MSAQQHGQPVPVGGSLLNATTLICGVLIAVMATIVLVRLIFGLGAAWVVILGIFFFDLFVTAHGWCSHLCPVGAFYSLVGRKSVVRVSAPRRNACNDCMDCFAVCPEPEVIPPALRGAKKGTGPVILDALCTNCGRCIDVCGQDVFEFSTRFNNRLPAVERDSAAAPGLTEERTSS